MGGGCGSTEVEDPADSTGRGRAVNRRSGVAGIDAADEWRQQMTVLWKGRDGARSVGGQERGGSKRVRRSGRVRDHPVGDGDGIGKLLHGRRGEARMMQRHSSSSLGLKQRRRRAVVARDTVTESLWQGVWQ